jgi:hypothetical protein
MIEICDLALRDVVIACVITAELRTETNAFVTKAANTDYLCVLLINLESL